MQLTMFLVLVGSVGLAALVDQQRAGMNKVSLGPLFSNGSLHFRVPENWSVTQGFDFEDPRIVATAVETKTGGDSKRTIRVFHQSLRRPISAQEYMERTGLLVEIFGDAAVQQVQVEHTILANTPALRLHAQAAIQTMQRLAVESDVAICAVFPNRQAVTLWLSKPGDFTHADDLLLQQIAASVQMDGLPAPTASYAAAAR
jgi:hypothetical protein